MCVFSVAKQNIDASVTPMRCSHPQANVVIESFEAVTGNPTRTVDDLPGSPSSSSASAQGLSMPPPATPALAAAPYSGLPT